ncbi:signal peptidase I [Dactylosporangium sp. NPDC000521]|uniref:signal peptidase I n=1 Tax=Dactylosporangium sp. NPDC000521 TaxID=3363975 RepID=UPI003691444B
MTALHARPASAPAPWLRWPDWRVLVQPVAAGVLGFVFSMLAVTLVPMVLGWSSSVVLSGSMQPAIAPGDVVICAPAEPGRLTPGHVVRFRDPARDGRHLMHRIVEVRPDRTLVTKGDDNPAADSTVVPAGDVTGVARLRVPWVGLPALWWRDGQYGRVATLATALALLWWARHTESGEQPHARRSSADAEPLYD